MCLAEALHRAWPPFHYSKSHVHTLKQQQQELGGYAFRGKCSLHLGVETTYGKDAAGNVEAVFNFVPSPGEPPNMRCSCTEGFVGWSLNCFYSCGYEALKWMAVASVVLLASVCYPVNLAVEQLSYGILISIFLLRTACASL